MPESQPDILSELLATANLRSLKSILAEWLEADEEQQQLDLQRLHDSLLARYPLSAGPANELSLELDLALDFLRNSYRCRLAAIVGSSSVETKNLCAVLSVPRHSLQGSLGAVAEALAARLAEQLTQGLEQAVLASLLRYAHRERCNAALGLAAQPQADFQEADARGAEA